MNDGLENAKENTQSWKAKGLRDFPFPSEPRPGLDTPDKVPAPSRDKIPPELLDPSKTDVNKFIEKQEKKKKSPGDDIQKILN